MSEDLRDKITAAIDRAEQVARRANVVQDDPNWWVSEVAASGGGLFTVRSQRDNRPIARVQRLEGHDFDPGLILDGAAVAEHIALHDPAAVLRRCAADRRVLERHAPHYRYNGANPECSWCWTPREEPADWPCEDYRDLADRYGIEVEA